MITDEAEVDGLPKSALALAAQQAGAELKKVRHHGVNSSMMMPGGPRPMLPAITEVL